MNLPSLKSLLKIVLLALFLISFFGASKAEATVIQKPPNNLGLVGFWSFNEGNGTIAHDFSGSGNTGTLTGGPTWVDGRHGQAVNFDGSDDYVDAGTSVSLNGEGTISLWIKTTSSATGGRVISKETSSYDTPYIIYKTGAGEFRFFTSTSIGGSDYADVIMVSSGGNSGEWQHLVATVSTTQIKTYLNGVLVNTASWTKGIKASNEKTFIGGSNYAGSPQFFYPGAIDDVRIYNRALSATEVATLYQSGSAKIVAGKTTKINASQNSKMASGLIALWSFDGKDTPWTSSTAATAVDSSGNGNTGTLTNMNQASSPTIGKIGQALNFNGSSQYVSAAHNSSFNWASPYSVSVWFKFTNGTLADVVFHSIMTSPYSGWCLEIASSKLRFLVDGGTTPIITTVPTLNTNQWYHAVVTKQSPASNYVVYIDGVNQTSASDTTEPTSSSVSLLIGAGFPDPRFFPGSIDDVRIYNRALSAAEVLQLYNLGR